MKNIVKSTPVPLSGKKLTNHSARKKLRTANVERQRIIQVTGHASEQSLQDYDEGTEQKQQVLSSIISNNLQQPLNANRDRGPQSQSSNLAQTVNSFQNCTITFIQGQTSKFPVAKVPSNQPRVLFHELVDVNNQWIDTNIFPPSSWSAYRQPFRTNNDIERWHNFLNLPAGGKVHLPFYLLIHLLHQESSVWTVQLRLVNARKLQMIQHKKYRALQVRIFGYMEDYAGSKILSMRLLKACSHLAYGPVPQIRFWSSLSLLLLQL